MSLTIKKIGCNHEIFLRWVTSITFIPILIWLIGFANHIWLLFLVLLVTAIGNWELNRILSPDKEREVSNWLFGALSLLLPVLSYTDGLYGLLIALLINMLGFFIEAVTEYGKCNSVTKLLSLRFFSVIYLPFLISHILFLPRIWIFFTLSVIFTGDSGAFFIGKKLGKHKLCPKISPGKTIEGSIGGLGMSIFVAFLFGILFNCSRSLYFLIIMGFLLSAVGQLGDMIESILKRERKIKDSGIILPGHGGLLDRLDSLLMAFPLVFYLIST